MDSEKSIMIFDCSLSAKFEIIIVKNINQIANNKIKYINLFLTNSFKVFLAITNIIYR